jgi:hypothetical protein
MGLLRQRRANLEHALPASAHPRAAMGLAHFIPARSLVSCLACEFGGFTVFCFPVFFLWSSLFSVTFYFFVVSCIFLYFYFFFLPSISFFSAFSLYVSFYF